MADNIVKARLVNVEPTGKSNDAIIDEAELQSYMHAFTERLNLYSRKKETHHVKFSFFFRK